MRQVMSSYCTLPKGVVIVYHCVLSQLFSLTQSALPGVQEVVQTPSMFLESLWLQIRRDLR